MKSSTAKMLAGGRKITKVVTWDAIGQPDEDGAKVRRSASILREDTGRYHEDGLEDEDGYRLSQVLRTDMVLEIWTAEGKAWDSGITTHAQVLTSRVDSVGRVQMICESCGTPRGARKVQGERADMVLCKDCEQARREDV